MQWLQQLLHKIVKQLRTTNVQNSTSKASQAITQPDSATIKTSYMCHVNGYKTYNKMLRLLVTFQKSSSLTQSYFDEIC